MHHADRRDAKLLKHTVIANQSADWCGNPLLKREIPTSGFALLGMTPFSYSPMDCMTLFRATFMGSLSGSLAEGSPLQSQS